MTQRRMLKTLINLILIFAGFAAIFAGPVCYLWQGTLSIWWLAAWLPVFGLLHLARVRVRSFVLFILLHLVLVILPVVLYQTMGFPGITFLSLMLLAVVSAVFSVYYRFHPIPSPFTLVWPGCVAALVYFFVSARYTAPGLMGFESLCAVVLLGFTPLLRQMERLDESIQVLESHHTSMSKQRLVRQNNILALTYTGLIIAAASIAPLLTEGLFLRFLRFIGDRLYAFIRFIAGLLPEWSDPTPPPALTEMPEESYSFASLMPEPENTLLRDILGVIWQVLYYAIVLVIVVGGMYAAVKIIQYLYHRFQNTRETDGDLIESLGRKDVTGRKARKRGKPGPDFGTGEERRVRKLYYKTIRQHKGPLPRPSDTPGKILRERGDIEGLDALTKEYNHVRYAKSKENVRER